MSVLLWSIFNSGLPQSLTLGSLLPSILSPDDFINSHGLCYCQNVKDYKRYTSIPADTSLWAPGPDACRKLTFIDCSPSALPSAVVHVFNLVSYILSHFILFFVSKYTYINKIYILIKTKMIKKDESYQPTYCSPSYNTSSPAHPQVSTISLTCVLI